MVFVQDVLSIVTGCLESLLFSGNIFGWFSLHFVLEKEGYFSNLCDNNDTENQTTYQEGHRSLCNTQESNFNLVYTLAVSFLLFLNFPFGYLFDRFGTWVFRTTATAMFSLGYVLLAVSTSETSDLLYPSIILIGVGGISLLVSNFQVANFVSSSRGLIITLINGLFDSSVLIFFVFKKIYEAGIELRVIVSVMTCLTIFLWLRTFLLMPRKRISILTPEVRFKYGWEQWICFKKDNHNHENDIKINELVATTISSDTKQCCKDEKQEEKVTFKACMKKKIYWTNVFHFSLLGFRSNFFLGTLQTWLKGFASSEEVSELTDIVSILLMFGVFVAPFNGIILDVIVKILKKRDENERVVHLKAAAASMLTTSCLQILFSILVVIPSAYGSFVLILISRSFIFGGNSAFLSFNFPNEHFGKLFGVTNFIAGLVNLLQYAIVDISLSLDPTFFYSNIVLIIVAISTLAHPIALYFEAKNSKYH